MEYQDGPRESDDAQWGASVEELVRSTTECLMDPTQIESGRSGETQQEVSNLQERVFTQLDGRSVRVGSSHVGGRTHL